MGSTRGASAKAGSRAARALSSAPGFPSGRQAFKAVCGETDPAMAWASARHGQSHRRLPEIA